MDKNEDPSNQTSVVKSAGRVLLVFEYFRDIQRPATAREVSQALGMPRSSTNALLSSLVNLSYVWFDDASNTYYPTMSVALLGNWMFDSFREDGRLGALLEDLSKEVGETITLAAQVGTQAQFLKVINSTFSVALNINPGFKVSLFTSAVGLALLASLPGEQVGMLVSSYNGRVKDRSERIVLSQLIQSLNDVRRQGVAVGYDVVLEGVGAVATGIRGALYDQPCVISIGGPIARIQKHEEDIKSALRSLLDRHGLLEQSLMGKLAEISSEVA